MESYTEKWIRESGLQPVAHRRVNGCFLALGAILPLLKIALQMAHDDYHQRRARQQEGIKLAQAEGRYKGRSPNQKQHDLIVKLRAHHTIEETAKLAGCSTSLVKLVMRKHKSKNQPDSSAD